jgi:Skp family chaperone for outer membrane proteins
VEFDKRSQALEEQKSQLESEEQKYRQADKSQMGPEQRTKLEKSFGDRELDLSSAEKRFDEDYKQRASQISRLFQDSTLNAIKQVAIEKGYDVVMPDLPYVNPSLDITEEVLRKLGQVQLPPVGTSSGKPSK